jgi:hypothetical protein
MPSATDRVIPQGISPSFNCLQNDFRREGRGHVRCGERGTMIVKASTSVPQSERERSVGSEEDPRAVPFARASLRNDFATTSLQHHQKNSPYTNGQDTGDSAPEGKTAAQHGNTVATGAPDPEGKEPSGKDENSDINKRNNK